MENSQPSRISPLLILASLLLLFVVVGNVYYFYLKSSRIQPPAPSNSAIDQSGNDNILADLTPSLSTPANSNPATNRIVREKGQFFLDSLTDESKYGFLGGTYITTIFTGRVVEVIKTPHDRGGTVFPMGLVVANDSGVNLPISFSQAEIDKIRIALNDGSGKLKDGSYNDLFPGDQVFITATVNLLDPRINVDDVSIEIRRK